MNHTGTACRSRCSGDPAPRYPPGKPEPEPETGPGSRGSGRPRALARPASRLRIPMSDVHICNVSSA